MRKPYHEKRADAQYRGLPRRYQIKLDGKQRPCYEKGSKKPFREVTVSERDLIQKLRALGVVERREVVLASGSLSDIYCDIKKAFGPPEIFSELINRIGAMLRPSITCIAGAGLGGIPLASAIAFRYGRKFCAIRLEPKAYGLANVIEGHTPSRDDRIAIVDDVFTTGGNVRDVMAKLKPTGANISRVVVVVNRSRGEDKFFPIPVLYLFRIEELI